VPRRRFRRLQVEPPAEGDAPEGAAAEPAFTRPLELDGRAPPSPAPAPPATPAGREGWLFTPGGDAAGAEARRAKPAPGAPEPARAGPDATDAAAATAPGATARPPTPEAGFGTVLLAGVFTACLFALVSIPVRLAFAAAFEDGMPWRAASELALVAVGTLVLHRVFAPALRRL